MYWLMLSGDHSDPHFSVDASAHWQQNSKAFEVFSLSGMPGKVYSVLSNHLIVPVSLLQAKVNYARLLCAFTLGILYYCKCRLPGTV
jgi:hypothetical protein